MISGKMKSKEWKDFGTDNLWSPTSFSNRKFFIGHFFDGEYKIKIKQIFCYCLKPLCHPLPLKYIKLANLAILLA